MRSGLTGSSTRSVTAPAGNASSASSTVPSASLSTPSVGLPTLAARRSVKLAPPLVLRNSPPPPTPVPSVVTIRTPAAVTSTALMVLPMNWLRPTSVQVCPPSVLLSTPMATAARLEKIELLALPVPA